MYPALYGVMSTNLVGNSSVADVISSYMDCPKAVDPRFPPVRIFAHLACLSFTPGTSWEIRGRHDLGQPVFGAFFLVICDTMEQSVPMVEQMTLCTPLRDILTASLRSYYFKC